MTDHIPDDVPPAGRDLRAFTDELRADDDVVRNVARESGDSSIRGISQLRLQEPHSTLLGGLLIEGHRVFAACDSTELDDNGVSEADTSPARGECC